MGRAYAVLEAIVHGGREHVIHTAQLLQVSQPLELLGVNDIPTTFFPQQLIYKDSPY